MGLFRWILRALGFSSHHSARGRRSEYLPSAERSPSRFSDEPQPQPPSTADESAQPVSSQAATDPAAFQASQFAPISQGELQQQAGQLGPLWQNPWFGRRDLIPPADDPRTALIDRAMVSHGFVTPEELEQIHAVGAEMQQLRPDFAHAQQAAAAAVQQTRDERETRKQQKKAEAARRLAERAAAIAERRRTDIIFLGRGVSRGLADRQSHVERLQQADLPVLSTPADLAAALEISISELRWLAFHSIATQRTHYVQFTIPKSSGGTRVLAAPLPKLAKAQRWVDQQILRKITPHDAAHGFVKQRSTHTNALPHVGKPVLIGVDLKDFFPSLTFFRIEGAFRSLGYSPAVATILGLLCTECPRRNAEFNGELFHVAVGERSLPQGACTSPALSNLVTRRLDKRLSGLAKKSSVSYTRYADDLTFSGSTTFNEQAGRFLASVRHIVQEEGFELNPDKTRIQRPNTRQTVTGVVVNARPGVPRATVRRLRAILHRAQYEGLELQNRDKHPHFESWITGMLAYIQMINPQQAAPLQQAWQRLQP